MHIFTTSILNILQFYILIIFKTHAGHINFFSLRVSRSLFLDTRAKALTVNRYGYMDRGDAEEKFPVYLARNPSSSKCS